MSLIYAFVVLCLKHSLRFCLPYFHHRSSDEKESLWNQIAHDSHKTSRGWFRRSSNHRKTRRTLRSFRDTIHHRDATATNKSSDFGSDIQSDSDASSLYHSVKEGSLSNRNPSLPKRLNKLQRRRRSSNGANTESDRSATDQSTLPGGVGASVTSRNLATHNERFYSKWPYTSPPTSPDSVQTLPNRLRRKATPKVARTDIRILQEKPPLLRVTYPLERRIAELRRRFENWRSDYDRCGTAIEGAAGPWTGNPATGDVWGRDSAAVYQTQVPPSYCTEAPAPPRKRLSKKRPEMYHF